jgi:hypothetical protein
MEKWVLATIEKADFVADRRHCGKAATTGLGPGLSAALRLPLRCGEPLVPVSVLGGLDDKSAGPGSGVGSYGTRVLSQTRQSLRIDRWLARCAR